MFRRCMCAWLGIVIGSCTSGSETRDRITLSDSAGIPIVENAADSVSVLDWILDDVPLIQLGREEGTGPDVFGSVRHAIRLRTGAIAVVDGTAQQIRVFGLDGRHLRTMGRHGNGPGEFSNLWRITELPGDSIAAVDALNGRLSVFGPEGIYARSYNVPRAGEGAPNVVGALADGTAVVQALAEVRSRQPGSQSRILVYTVDRSGQISGRIGEFLHTSIGKNGMPLALGPTAVVFATDSLIWYGHTSALDFQAFGRDGSVRRIVRVDRKPRPVSEEEIAESRAGVSESLIRQGASPGLTQLLLDTEFAEYHPLFKRLLQDRAGYLWVGRQGNVADENGGTDRSVETWDVLSPDGRLLGCLATVPGFRTTQIGEDYVIGVYTDSLGVQYVRMYGLHRT